MWNIFLSIVIGAVLGLILVGIYRFDVSMNKLYKEEMKEKMLSHKFMIPAWAIASVLCAIAVYFIIF